MMNVPLPDVEAFEPAVQLAAKMHKPLHQHPDHGGAEAGEGKLHLGVEFPILEQERHARLGVVVYRLEPRHPHHRGLEHERQFQLPLTNDKGNYLQARCLEEPRGTAIGPFGDLEAPIKTHLAVSRTEATRLELRVAQLIGLVGEVAFRGHGALGEAVLAVRDGAVRGGEIVRPQRTHRVAAEGLARVTIVALLAHYGLARHPAVDLVPAARLLVA